jgi:hypothetical protein
MGQYVKMNKKIILVILGLLFLITLITIITNYSNKYDGIMPAADTYFFCSQSNQIVKEGNLLDYSPDYTNRDNLYAPGFSLFISNISILTGIGVKEIIYNLPFLSFIFLVVSIFLLVRGMDINKKYLYPCIILSLGIIISSFILFRQLSIGIPQTLTLALIFFSVYLTNQSNKNKNYFYVNLIFLLALFALHYLSFLISFSYFLIYFLINYKRIKKIPIFYILIFLFLIAPLILRSELIGIFNPQFTSEFNLVPFVFSTEAISIFMHPFYLPLILLVIIPNIFKNKNIPLNIFTLIIFSTLFLSHIPFLDIFSPYIKRAILFLILFISILLPANLFNFLEGKNKFIKILSIFIIVTLIFQGAYSYEERAWVKYFDIEDTNVANKLEINESIIAIYPYNLLIQCYQKVPSKKVIRINAANMENLMLMDPGNYGKGTLFYFNNNTLNILKKSGLGINETLFMEITEKWKGESEYYTGDNVTVYIKNEN